MDSFASEANLSLDAQVEGIFRHFSDPESAGMLEALVKESELSELSELSLLLPERVPWWPSIMPYGDAVMPSIRRKLLGVAGHQVLREFN